MKRFPKLHSGDCDTIIQINTSKMLPSSSKVWGIGVADSLYLLEDMTLSRTVDSEIGDREGVELKLFVDAQQTEFHSNQMSFWELTPHLKDVDIPLPIYKEAVLRDKYQKPRMGDSLLTEYYRLKEKRKRIHHQSYPLYIYSPGEKAVSIQKSTDNQLVMILEAKNVDGEWKPVEYLEQLGGFRCGFGHKNYELPENMFLMVTVKRYSGDYKTRLRLKLRSFQKTYYSNSFPGFINYSQFVQDSVINDLVHRFADPDVERIKSRIRAAFLDY